MSRAVLFRQTEVRHHRHVLNLQLGAVVGTARMQFGIEDVRQVVFSRSPPASGRAFLSDNKAPSVRAGCESSARCNRSSPSRRPCAGSRRTCRRASAHPRQSSGRRDSRAFRKSPRREPRRRAAARELAVETVLPEVSRDRLICSSSCMRAGTTVAALLVSVKRQKVGIFVPGRNACGSFSHSGIHSLRSFRRTSFKFGPTFF